MRVVTEPNGGNWICLETPVPGQPEGTTMVECNSGAERVELSVPADWESLPDAELLARIHAAGGTGR